MRRVYSLDVLRILATICIIFHHYQQLTGAFFEGKLNFYGGMFYFGFVVEFFFVLSGFLAYKYVDKKEMTFPKFYLPKMRRLLPLVLVSSVAYEIFLYVYQRVTWKPWVLGNKCTIWGVIINALGIQSGWGFETPSVNNPVWYVSVLLLCQVIFFFLLFVSRRKEIPVVYLFFVMIFIGAGIKTYQWDLPFLNDDTGRGYVAFFFGLVLAHFLREKEVSRKAVLISFLIIAGMTYGLIFHYNYFEQGLSYLMTFVYYAACIVLFMWQPVQKLFNFKALGVMGEITYDMYVWHVPVILLMYVICEMNFVTPPVNSYKMMFAFLAIMVVVGTISHYCIDKPIQKILKKNYP